MIGFDICRLLSHQTPVYENLIGLFNLNELPTKKNFAINTTQLQSNNSALCGEFILFYIVRRIYDDDISFSEF